MRPGASLRCLNDSGILDRTDVILPDFQTRRPDARAGSLHKNQVCLYSSAERVPNSIAPFPDGDNRIPVKERRFR